MNSFKELVNTYFAVIFKAGIIIVVLSTFFLFTNLTTEFYEAPKFLVLLTFTGILLILLTLKFTLTNRVVIVRTPLDIPLLLLLAVGIVSTVLSPSPYISLLGNQLKLDGSLVSLVVYILFYFVLVNSLKTAKDVKWILYVSLISAQILSIISLVAYSGIKILPDPWTHGTNFTTTGFTVSTTAILALLIPLVVNQILSPGKIGIKIANSVFLVIMGTTIALTGTWATWSAAVLGLVLTYIVIGKPFGIFDQTKWINLMALAFPAAIVLLISALSFIPPVGGAKNPLYTQFQNFPREVQIPFVTSWKVSVSAFRDMPFWGTGPSTYLFDFTTYKPIEFNSSKFWNVRFDTPFNEYLGTLATFGGIGVFALLSLTALFLSSASKVILSSFKSTEHQGLTTSLAISGIAFFIILALHASTLVIWVFGLLILACFMVLNISETSVNRSDSGKNVFMKIASNIYSTDSSTETIKIDALPSIMFTLAISLVLGSFFFAGKFALADYHHRLALNAVSQNQGIVVYNELVTAEKLNPINDLYRTDLAQTNFALANAIASAKAPTEASPAGSLTDQDKLNIQTLLQQSIDEAKTAVTLSPRSTVNWEILGLLYRQISGVAENALVFSLDSYGRAIFQDPLNPLLRLNVGGVYYAIRNYDLAIRFFTDAINLKPDFANGYYNLSVALRDKGDLATAQAAAEKVLTLVEANSQDYKVASDYLTDLKTRIASGSASESQIQPPAAQTTGSLQQEELPKVLDLPQPSDIATPSAVKKPNSTPEPSPTP